MPCRLPLAPGLDARPCRQDGGSSVAQAPDDDTRPAALAQECAQPIRSREHTPPPPSPCSPPRTPRPVPPTPRPRPAPRRCPTDAVRRSSRLIMPRPYNSPACASARRDACNCASIRCARRSCAAQAPGRFRFPRRPPARPADSPGWPRPVRPRARRPRPVANPSPAAAGSGQPARRMGAAARQGLAGQVAGDLDITGQGQARV